MLLCDCDPESYKAAFMQMKKAFYISFMFVGSKEYFQAIGEYLQLDQKEKTEECMKYVAEHGNTLPIGEQALKYPECGTNVYRNN